MCACFCISTKFQVHVRSHSKGYATTSAAQRPQFRRFCTQLLASCAQNACRILARGKGSVLTSCFRLTSVQIINTLTSFLLVSFVDDWPLMDHDAITTRCFNHMVLFIRDCGPMFGSAFVVTSMQSILLKIKQHTDPDPRSIFTFKAQIRLLELLYNTPHFLILNRLATLDSATPLDPVMLMRHCGHFALLCASVDELRNSPFDESNYCESFKLAWDVLLRVDSMELSVDADLRHKIAMLFWPLLCSILSLYHQNVNFLQIWSQPMRTKLFTMCLFVIANVPRPNLMKWLENQTDSCLISFIDLLKVTRNFIVNLCIRKLTV